MEKKEMQVCKDWWDKKPAQFNLWLKAELDLIFIDQSTWNKLSNKIDAMSRENARLKRRVGED